MSADWWLVKCCYQWLRRMPFATRPSLSPGTCFSVAWCKWSGFPAGDEEEWCCVAFDLVSCHHTLMLVLHERCWSKPLSSYIVCTPPSLSSGHLPAFTCKSHRLNNYMWRCAYGSKWGGYYRSLEQTVGAEACYRQPYVKISNTYPELRITPWCLTRSVNQFFIERFPLLNTLINIIFINSVPNVSLLKRISFPPDCTVWLPLIGSLVGNVLISSQAWKQNENSCF